MNKNEIIKQMSINQKVSLTSGKDFWQTQNIDKFNVPSIFLSDGPHGIRKQAAAADHLGLNASIPSTCFPTAATMANSWDRDLCEELGKALGKEAASLDVNILLGPGMNIKRNPLCGRNFEYFSEDPYLTGKIASSYVKGIQSNNISACIKHFACNNQETRRMVSNSIMDERTLREIYLTGFEIVVKEAKPWSIMTSYNRLNGVYTNENHHLLQDILKNDWGYDGFIVTDWGGNNDRIKGLKEGNALEMPTTKGETDQEIVEAIKSGVLEEKVLDERVEEILDVIEKTQVGVKNKQSIDYSEHHNLARKCAEESLVLLKNENNVLPLNKNEKICLIGDFFSKARYQGAGSSIVNPTKLENILDIITDYDLNYIGYQKGYNRYGKKNKSLLKKAIKLAKNSDLILYSMGLDEVTEAEGLDRKDTNISYNQIELLKELRKLNKKIVVVLTCGSVVDLSWDEDCDGLLHAYLSGQAGARAILNILTGKVNPSGKLSETYPLKYSDVPSSNDFPTKGISIPYKESIFVGYRYFNLHKDKIKYPFGYGLSYTQFGYSSLEIDEQGVKFKVKNIGNLKGKEIVQLYIRKDNSSIFRPESELKGFSKIDLDVNEEKEVELLFDQYSFRYFNPVTNKFEVEAGEYQILIGSSSLDIKLNGTINIAGTTNVLAYNKDQLINYYKGNISNIDNEEFSNLLGYSYVDKGFNFYKKNRMIVDVNTTVCDLKYSKGWSGRLFSGVIRFAINLLKFFGNKSLSNTLIMGVYYNPMRGLSRMSGGIIGWKQLEGLITMFNGRFFKGLGIVIKNSGKRNKNISD